MTKERLNEIGNELFNYYSEIRESENEELKKGLNDAMLGLIKVVIAMEDESTEA